MPSANAPILRMPALRRVLAALTVGLLAVVGLVAVPNAAVAAQNTAIIVGDVAIKPADAQATIGDTLTVSGSWDATTADPKPGDQFTIGLPPALEFPQAVPFTLKGRTPEGDEVIWGTCLTDPQTSVATCVLTDEVDDFPELVSGTWEFQVRAAEATTEEGVEFDLNGTPVVVDLPGNGGIDDGVTLPGEVTKSGRMNSDNWSMTWTIDIPGKSLVAAGGSVAHITDTFGVGHVLCDPIGLKVQTVRGDRVTDVTSLATMHGRPADASFALDLAAPTGGFDSSVTYRLTYRTCTSDGEIDPSGTQYSNSAEIEGWGSAGIGVGTVTNKPWQQSVTKSGSVLGGPDRNGKLAWTIVVPGDKLVGQNAILFTDALGAGHEFPVGWEKDIRVREQYGPDPDDNPALNRDVTGKLGISGKWDTTSASMRLEISNPAEFAFQPSDWRYIITYYTHVTDTKLPGGGTVYTNTASVNGSVTTGSGTVPDRSEGKTGRINTSTVTIDDVQHLPQTTLDWGVTIPGAEIESIESDLTLHDAFSASQRVCSAGDPSQGLKSRLRLKVEARDQIKDGGLQPVDLTSKTTVSATDTGLTFTIARTDLPIPGGESDGFSREYQYVISYTTCTTSGGMDAPGTVYDNAVTGEGLRWTSSVTQNNSGSGTGTGVTRGSIAIDKLLADSAGAAFVPADARFTVHVQEIDPNGRMQIEYDLAVPLNGDPVSGPNSRGTGWTVRLSEPSFPKIPGVVFGDPVFAATAGVTPTDGGKKAVAALTPGKNVSVALTNTAQLGGVDVTKVVTGPAAALAAPDRTYRVTASIDTSMLGAEFPAQPTRVFDITAGQTVQLTDLPIGATVTFSETRPADDDQLTWAAPVITPASVVVTAAHAATPAAVTVTNRVERTVGTFSVVKTVTGDQAQNAAVPASVVVTATWSQEGVEGSKTLTVPTDGTPVELGENLLIGTVVTLTETPLSDGSGIAWGAPVWTGDGVDVDGASAQVSIGRDAQAQVSLENHAATSVAGISLLKGIAGAAAGEVAGDAEFPVTAGWTDGKGVTHSKRLTINASTPTPLGVELPAGTVVTISEGAGPAYDTVIWGAVTISGDDVTDLGEGRAEVVVSDQQSDSTLVTVVNEATWAPGTFTLVKEVEGVLLDDPDLPESVTVTATWTLNGEQQSAAVELPLDGTAVAFGQDLPHGTRVLLSEVAPADVDAFTWNTPTWQGEGIVANEDGTATLTVSAATDPQLTLTNGVTARLGSLSITKVLTGSGAELMQNAQFPVTATWTDLLGEVHEQELTVTAGEPTVLEGLPLGTEVTLVEHAADAPANARWHGATWSSDDETVALGEPDGDAITVVVTGEEGASAEVTVTNEYEKLPDLATTGGVLSVGITLLAGLLICAGVLLLAMRRRRV